MGKFLKAAFFLRYPVPVLGRVPLNIMFLAATAILGIVHPGIWLLGAAGEAAYLLALTSSARFRRYVTGMELAGQQVQADAKRQTLVSQLDRDSQAKLASLEKRSARVLELYEGQGAEGYVIDSSREALQRLSWMYLKLLLASNYLRSQESVVTQEKLGRDVAALNAELASDKISPALRESKTATLRIYQRRLENLLRREQSLQEMSADLQRIEAQVELAVDEAAMQGRPHAVSASIDLVTPLLDIGAGGCFGELETPTVQELEAAFHAPPAAAATAAQSKEEPLPQ